MRWLLAFVLMGGVSVFAEDYLAEGVDNGRTGWLKNEKIFTTANVGSMKLLWKIKVNSTPRQMHNLFAPLTVSGVTTARGARELAIFAGISDELYAIDVATGEMIWEKKFDSIYPSVTTGVGSTLCPGGQTAVPVITPTPTKGKYTIYAVSWDGRLRTLDVATGADVAPPDKFAGPNGKPYALNLFDGVIYTSTAQGCGGNTNAFLSYDLQTKKSSIFAPAGGGMWGRRGVAIDPEGRVFMGTGDAPFAAETNSLGTAIVAAKLDANKQLQFVDYFAPPNANWLFRRDLDLNVSPMAFDYRGRKFLVATSKECKLWLLDRDDLGGSGQSNDAADNSPALQRRAGVRWEGHLGRTRRMAGRQGTSVGRRAVLRAGQPHVQGAGRARAAGQRRSRGLHARGTRRQVAAHPAMAFARYGHGRTCDRCQRHRLYLCQRRGRLADCPRPRVRRSGRSAGRGRRQ